SVTAVDQTEPNRLVRIQPTTPTDPIGGRSRVAAWPEAAMLVLMGLALHQRDARVVPVHEQADRQAYGQIDGHDDRDALDRLAGLVQRRVGNRNNVLIADCY